MHDNDKIMRRCCAGRGRAETPEGKDEPVSRKAAEAHPVRFIGRVVDAPLDIEPGDAEDPGSCCTKCYSDEKAFTDIPPDGVAAIAVQAQTTENLADESRLRRSWFPLLDYPEYSNVPYANPVVQTEEKIVEAQQVQTIERIVEIRCQEVIRHMTVSQFQEVIRQVSSSTDVLEVDKRSY